VFITELIITDAWLSALVRTYISLKTVLLRSPIDSLGIDMFGDVVHSLEPHFLNTPRRQDSWYLSILAVHPVYQGQRLGRALLQEGLDQVDKSKSASYLVGLQSVEAFYPKFGFKEVLRANVGELKDWDGGSVMFRDDNPEIEDLMTAERARGAA
jgi:GNAT superfamily N-acetyltransferase